MKERIMSVFSLAVLTGVYLALRYTYFNLIMVMDKIVYGSFGVEFIS